MLITCKSLNCISPKVFSSTSDVSSCPCVIIRIGPSPNIAPKIEKHHAMGTRSMCDLYTNQLLINSRHRYTKIYHILLYIYFISVKSLLLIK